MTHPAETIEPDPASLARSLVNGMTRLTERKYHGDTPLIHRSG
jgi:hypothetical protein